MAGKTLYNYLKVTLRAMDKPARKNRQPNPITWREQPGQRARLERVMAVTGRPRNALISEAVDRLLEELEAQHGVKSA